MDISKMDLTDLKAFAYDLISQYEQVKANLEAVNAQIQVKKTQEDEIRQKLAEESKNHKK